jgi:regulator of protease activity HflC (stomatin/prohibitin superfamily)
VTTLRNVIGAMDLEECLTSREKINSQLRIVLDEASGKWGIRVNRVEIKAIDPPPTIKEAMEKQMRAERDKRAAILNAEGVRQAKILTAEGEKQSAILNAEGARQSAVLRADGQAQAIDRVFTAIHRNDPDPKLLAYQYLQVLPELAKGEGNTFWVIPSEVTNALQGVSQAFAKDTGESAGPKAPPHEEGDAAAEDATGPAALEAPRDRAAAAAKAAEEAAAEAHQEAEKAKADERDARP